MRSNAAMSSGKIRRPEHAPYDGVAVALEITHVRRRDPRRFHFRPLSHGNPPLPVSLVPIILGSVLDVAHSVNGCPGVYGAPRSQGEWMLVEPTV